MTVDTVPPAPGAAPGVDADPARSARLRRLWPEGVQLNPVQPGLKRSRLIVLGLSYLCVTVALIVLAVFTWHQPVARIVILAAASGAVAVLIWLLWLIPRQVRALGWGITKTDLYVRRGIMFSALHVVPLERLQYVELSQGPIARACQIATIELHTASAGSDASIPGLDPVDAQQLRERLSTHSGVELSGI